jgi:AMP phosphorylase
MDEQTLALDAIRKKLVGKQLNYKEIFAIMDEIAKEKLGSVLTTYFAASGYSKGFSDKELYFLTKAMVETGEKLQFEGIVADKHSIGGVPGTRTTMIVVPIIASAGFTIPKSSSRAITTPGGTADDMEVLCPVTFTKEQIYEIVHKTNGCIVWGGSFSIAPADDVLIKVEAPLLFESYDKIIVSILAKKIAFGSNHVVIDLPYGKDVKVHRESDAQVLADKFTKIAHEFGMKIKVLSHHVGEPAGRGIGPVLETREALRVLEQGEERPLDLEERALSLAGELLELCLADSHKHLRDTVYEQYKTGRGWAEAILRSGQAHEKMLEIIKAQGGSGHIESKDLHPGNHTHSIKATKGGKVKAINSKNATLLAKILGAPVVKKAGLYLDKKAGETVEKGDSLFTLYTENAHSLKEAIDSAENFPVTLFE